MDKQQLAIIGVFAVGAWVAWLIFSALRQYMAVRVQIASQDKLLLRLNSPESLQVFLASEVGLKASSVRWREIRRSRGLALSATYKLPWYSVWSVLRCSYRIYFTATSLACCHSVWAA